MSLTSFLIGLLAAVMVAVVLRILEWPPWRWIAFTRHVPSQPPRLCSSADYPAFRLRRAKRRREVA